MRTSSFLIMGFVLGFFPEMSLAQPRALSYESHLADCELKSFKRVYLNFFGMSGDWTPRFDPPVTCEDAKKVDDLVTDIRSKFSTLKTKKVELYLVRENANAGAMFDGVHLPLILTGGTQDDLRNATVHEYGHLLFGWNMRLRPFSTLERMQMKKKLIVDMTRDSYYFELKQRSASDEEIAKKTQADDAILGRATGEVEAKLESRVERKVGLARAEKLVALYTGLSELYADLVAVLYSGDPDCIAKSGFLRKDHVQSWGRSFSDVRASWEGNEARGWPIGESHDLFAPVRFYLGQKWLSGSHDAAQVARRVIEAIRESAVQIVESPDFMSLEYKFGDNGIRVRSIQFVNKVLLERLEEKRKLISP